MPDNLVWPISTAAQFVRGTKAAARCRLGGRCPPGRRCSKDRNLCHVQAIKTAPPGTVINGGTFAVPAALGNKIIHPYGDFLLHGIGTGDGIVRPGRKILRTAPRLHFGGCARGRALCMTTHR